MNRIPVAGSVGMEVGHQCPIATTNIHTFVPTKKKVRAPEFLTVAGFKRNRPTPKASREEIHGRLFLCLPGRHPKFMKKSPLFFIFHLKPPSRREKGVRTGNRFPDFEEKEWRDEYIQQEIGRAHV